MSTTTEPQDKQRDAFRDLARTLQRVNPIPTGAIFRAADAGEYGLSPTWLPPFVAVALSVEASSWASCPASSRRRPPDLLTQILELKAHPTQFLFDDSAGPRSHPPTGSLGSASVKAHADAFESATAEDSVWDFAYWVEDNAATTHLDYPMPALAIAAHMHHAWTSAAAVDRWGKFSANLTPLRLLLTLLALDNKRLRAIDIIDTSRRRRSLLLGDGDELNSIRWSLATIGRLVRHDVRINGIASMLRRAHDLTSPAEAGES